MKTHFLRGMIALSSFGASLFAGSTLFEARHAHPLEINGDGTRLLAVNAQEGRLSIFATTEEAEARPVLISEIPVGLCPVTVRLRTADEAWVVNELSDCISIVSMSRGLVIATLPVGDEPADVVFAGGKAFVSCSRDNTIQVFDAVTRQRLATVPLKGLLPRNLCVSPDGTSVEIAFQHTSNGTTILPKTVAPPQAVPPNANPALPAPPQVGEIVSVDHPSIAYEVLDHDVARLRVSDHVVTAYRSNLGTNVFGLAYDASGRLWVANSEARNLILLEPQLRGRFARSQVALVDAAQTRQISLNADPDLSFPVLDAAAKAQALAQVMCVLPEHTGNSAWLAAFGSDRVAKVDGVTGQVTQSIDLRSLDPAGQTRHAGTVRGPRGLALSINGQRLYVLNKLSNTLSTVDLPSAQVLDERAVGSVPDLLPEIQLGRGFLYDARLSSNGSVSCASCHIDAERDGVAWDLGDPSGSMLTIPGAMNSLHLPNHFVNHQLHPMKGPMMTQTLVGLHEHTKLHWRGDKPSVESFNSTFPNLLGAPALASADMTRLANYLRLLRHHPNPNLKLDRTLAPTVQGGDPNAGLLVYVQFENHCAECHRLPSGTSNNLDIVGTAGSIQPMKDATLRTTYHRVHFNPLDPAGSVTGFGLLSDGSGHQLPIGHPYQLHILDDIDRPLAVRQKEKRDLSAFILSFDTGTPPAVGKMLNLVPGRTPSSQELADLTTLENQAANATSSVGLVAFGRWQGERTYFRFEASTRLYRAQGRTLSGMTNAQLRAGLQAGDALSFLGVPLDEVARFSGDRNENGQVDRVETSSPSLQLSPTAQVRWPINARDWFLESSSDLRNWQPLPRAPQTAAPWQSIQSNFSEAKRYFRLRRTW